MSAEFLLALLLKMLGAVAGAILALVFVPPRTVLGFFRRLSAALICGTIFAPYTQIWIGFAITGEGLVEAACATAFVSWWLMGTIKIAVETLWSIKQKSVDD